MMGVEKGMGEVVAGLPSPVSGLSSPFNHLQAPRKTGKLCAAWVIASRAREKLS